MSGLALEEATERAGALRSALAERVVVADGAMGTMLQASAATAGDFGRHEGCNEVLNVYPLTPDELADAHERFISEFGLSLIVLSESGAELERFTFPRQRRDARLCLADYFRPASSGETDVIAFQLATMGPAELGVQLSEEMQLHPEQSTDAIVVHHPEARYFSV